MKIFALDTSSEACSVALLQGTGDNIRIIEKSETLANKHAHLLLKLVDTLVHEEQLVPGELDAIAYGSGPGSFTGLRIASAVVQALSYVWQVKVFSVSTLEALAYSAYVQYQIENIISAVDARKNEVYINCFQFNKARESEALYVDKVCAPNLCPQFTFDDWIGIGSGWRQYGELLLDRSITPAHTINFNAFPSASSIAQLAYDKLLRGRMGESGLALPVYLRNDVV